MLTWSRSTLSIAHLIIGCRVKVLGKCECSLLVVSKEWKEYFKQKYFEYYEKLHKSITENLKYWQKYHSEKLKHPDEETEETINLTEILKESQLGEISFCINITENNAELIGNVYLGRIQLIYTYKKLLISYTTIVSSIIILSMLIGTVYFIVAVAMLWPRNLPLRAEIVVSGAAFVFLVIALYFHLNRNERTEVKEIPKHIGQFVSGKMVLEHNANPN